MSFTSGSGSELLSLIILINSRKADRMGCQEPIRPGVLLIMSNNTKWKWKPKKKKKITTQHNTKKQNKKIEWTKSGNPPKKIISITEISLETAWRIKKANILRLVLLPCRHNINTSQWANQPERNKCPENELYHGTTESSRGKQKICLNFPQENRKQTKKNKWNKSVKSRKKIISPATAIPYSLQERRFSVNVRFI